MDKTPLSQASEATIENALSYWKVQAKSEDASTRVVAYTEIQRLNTEVEGRQKLGLWRTGAYPGKSTFQW
jgi:hypothetical protein